MLTAESGKDNVLSIVKKGINDCMVKPFKGENLIKLIIVAFQQCQPGSVVVRLVADPKQCEELKGFQETSQITVSHSIEEAKAVLGAKCGAAREDRSCSSTL